MNLGPSSPESPRMAILGAFQIDGRDTIYFISHALHTSRLSYINTSGVDFANVANCGCAGFSR